jgi:hypothetical protein
LFVVVVVGGGGGGVVEHRCEFGPLPLKEKLVLEEGSYEAVLGGTVIENFLGKETRRVSGRFLGIHSCCSETIKRMGSCASCFFFLF